MLGRSHAAAEQQSSRTRQVVVAATAILVVSLGVLVWCASPAEAASGRVYSSEEVAFVAQLNHYRISNGQQPLQLSDTLSLAAERHCLDMAHHSFISHTTDTTRSDWFSAGAHPWDRMGTCGYDYDTLMGENVGVGQATADLLFDAFRASGDHNMVMLHEELSVIGIAMEEVTDSDGTYYWTADFGGHVDGSAQRLDVYQQNDSALSYAGAWVDNADSSCSGGDFCHLDSPGSVTVSFVGTSLSWIASKSEACGQASVTLDDGAPVEVDLYCPGTLSQRCVYSTGTLAEGEHTVVIEWTGSNNPDASGSLLTVDAFDVQGTLTNPEAGQYLADLFMRYLRLATLDAEPTA